MQKVIRLAYAIPASFVLTKADSSPASDLNGFVPVALFSGIGLLVSLIAILCGVQGAWY